MSFELKTISTNLKHLTWFLKWGSRVGKLEGNEGLGCPRHRRVDSTIKTDLKNKVHF
jgi:hypothetical protein